ncbi:hypothetical protein ID866_6142 [Astraeus odoratus]|nr:hypothetical protein ID866_6142 [Astraeus odoratus]
MSVQSQGPAGAGGSSTTHTASHRGRLGNARISPSKSIPNHQVVSPPAEQSTSTTGRGFNPGLLTPPSSQILDEDEDEEFLSYRVSKTMQKTPSKSISRTRPAKPHPSTPTRHTSEKAGKRQRATPSASDLRSPLPKKPQASCTCGSPVKRILYKSVHANNVNADYMPPGECPSRKCRMRSRSITPAYEPPAERFTPPREIVQGPFETPKVSRSTKRNPSSKAKGVSLRLKSEPPEIDLSHALRPPSPTDDPLLLSDSRPTTNQSHRCRFTPAFSSSPFNDARSRDPSMSFAARLSGGRVDDFGDVGDSDDLPVFAIPEAPDQVNDGGWSDSDDDEFNLTGEYTGKYKMVMVPTKADPPTSGTRGRMESWGRPVSPFPYRAILERSLPLSDLTEEDVLADGNQNEAPPAERGSDAYVQTELLPTDESSPLVTTTPSGNVGDSPSDEDEEVDVDVVKITSGDATTAARAAAILNLHDYDCVLASSGSPQPSKLKRRKTIGNAGISKPYADAKDRRQTINGYGISVPSGDVSLFDIWRSMEDSILVDHAQERTGVWTRKDWKHLDKCLIAERLAVGASLDQPAELLAPFDRISKDAVLDRFITEVGGNEVLHSFGPEWARANLMLRLEILIKRQQRLATTTSQPWRQGKQNIINCSTVPRYQSLLQRARAISPSAPKVTKPSLAAAAARRDVESVLTSVTSASISGDARRPEPLPCSPSLGVSGGMTFPRPPVRPPRLVHPKEQVHLRHASLPKRSMIPVPVRPRRLVDLKHWSPRKNTRVQSTKPTDVQPRRSSGCSVKDLIQCFEGLEESNRGGGS